MVTITVSAADLSRAYFPNRKETGAVMLPRDLGLTSKGRSVSYIEIKKASRRIILSGYYQTRVGGKPVTQKWSESYPSNGAPIDD